MSRSRRTSVDGSGTKFGVAWKPLAFAATDAFKTVNLASFGGFPLDFGGPAITDLVVWRKGVVSLGPVTAEQIKFMADYDPTEDVFQFPGNFISVGQQSNVPANQAVSYTLISEPVATGVSPTLLNQPTALFSITFGYPFYDQFTTDIPNVGEIVFDANGFTLDRGITSSFGGLGYRLGNQTFNPAALVDKPATLRNDSVDRAVSLDGKFSLVSTDDIVNSAFTPHASVTAKGSGSAEYYRFTAGAGVTLSVDIDYTTGIDTVVRLFDKAGNLIAQNDDGGAGDSGTGNKATDSKFDVFLANAGDYYLVVTAKGGNGVPVGASYFLNVSLTNAALASAIQPDPHDAFQLRGTSGPDVLVGTAAGESIAGLGGHDIIVGGGGGDRLLGGSGADTFRYLAVSDSTATGGFDNLTDFETGIDRIDLTALNTTGISVVRNSGSSFLFAQTPSGDFQLIAANRTIEAGDILYNNRHGIFVVGSEDGDVLIGSTNGDSIQGNGGDDLLIGGTGADSIGGGAGFDLFRYLATSDSSLSTGVDTLYDFETGIDKIDIAALNTSSISVIRSGNNSFVFSQTTTGDFQLVATNRAVNGSDFVYSNQHGIYLQGSEQGETLIGSAVGDPIQGNGGNDIIIGGGGPDPLAGGAGSDIFRYLATSDSTAAGSDIIADFETERDTIDLTALNTSSVSIIRSGGSSFLFAQTPGGDFQLAAGNRAINAVDLTYTNAHGVYFVGSDQGDILIGGAKGDSIQAGAGNDALIGGGGADMLAGEGGADLYRYLAASDSTVAAADLIMGFTSGVDKVDLTGIRTGAADTFGIVYSNGASFLFVDQGGNGTNDMLIQFNTTIVSSDLMWA